VPIVCWLCFIDGPAESQKYKSFTACMEREGEKLSQNYLAVGLLLLAFLFLA
jgi:hypothetical protein